MPPAPAEEPEVKPLLKWITTPPQSYLVYLVLVVVIGAASFYAGSLKQKPVMGLPPPAAAPAR
jgi:hypothetical protein